MLTDEDCRFLSDRYGEAIDGASEEETIAVDRLAEFFNDEVSFVVERHGQTGVLIEIELATPGSLCDGDADAIAAAWGKPMTLEQVVEIAEKRASDATTLFPDAETYACQHSGIFGGRIAIRSFIPDVKCSLNRIGQISRHHLDLAE